VPLILIVDDEEAIRSTFRAFLEAEGHKVTTACTAAEARDLLASEPFDVLLLDLMLPEESGLSLLKSIGDLEIEVSAVMVTGYPDLSTAVEALKEGAYDYFTKPITRQSLLAVVDRAAERKHLLSEKRRLEQENAEYQKSLERKVAQRTSELRDSEGRYRELFEETRQAYDDLRQAQGQLIQSEKLAAIGELAAGIAHEIRNPLSAISNSIGVLRRDLEVEGDDRRLLEVVFEESQRLAGTVADFLKYARPRPIQKSTQELGGILEDLLLLLSRDHRNSDRVCVESYYEDELPPVEIDATQTREAVWNLLVNGLEAMPEGGTLSVSVGRTRGSDPPAVEVSISDTGGGISTDERDKVFQPFYTTKPTGTGLGLATVQRIVEGHGGSVRLESDPGKGCSFTLRFPLTSDG
jgi:signal transduction histidine kinase